MALKRFAKNGGALEVLVPMGVVDFDATDGHAYAATQLMGVQHVEIPSTGAMTIGTLSGEAALAIAADEHGVSWVTCSTLTHASLDGASQIREPVTGTCANQATRLALDSSTAYGINGQGQWYASRSGGPIAGLASEKCSRLEAANGWLYCSHRDTGLRRFSPRTKDIELVIDGQVHTFAVGPSRIYAGVGQDLVANPRNTAQQEVYGTYAAISAITLDSKDVFFVNTEGNLGLLLRTAQ